VHALSVMLSRHPCIVVSAHQRWYRLPLLEILSLLPPSDWQATVKHLMLSIMPDRRQLWHKSIIVSAMQVSHLCDKTQIQSALFSTCSSAQSCTSTAQLQASTCLEQVSTQQSTSFVPPACRQAWRLCQSSGIFPVGGPAIWRALHFHGRQEAD
jgi:hypothetical protein